MEKKDQGTLGAYIDLFLRRKFLFLGVFAVLFAVLALGAMSVKTSFRARSLLAIGESEAMGIMNPRVGWGRPQPVSASASLSGKTYATIVEGLPMSTAVAERLGSDTLSVDPKYIHRAVRAEFYEPEVLEITATAKQPGHAVEIANAAALEFIEYNRAQIRSELQESANFVLEEVRNVERELALIQSEIGEFKKREEVTDLDVEVHELLGAVNAFEKDMLLAQADLAEETARYRELRDGLFDNLSVQVSPLEDPAIRGLVERASELEAELEIAKVEYGPEHPKRKLIEQQVATARANLGRAMSDGSDRTQTLTSEKYYGSLREALTTSAIKIAGLNARISSLDKAISSGRNRLAGLPPKQFEHRRLILRESITEDKYRRLLERLEEMEVEIEGIQGNASVLDLAAVARPTVSRAMLLIYVAVLSLLGSVAFVLTLEYRDNTIKSPEVITNVLNMTNFGVVPKIREMGRKWLEESADNHAFEHYRKLRANVRFSSVKKPIRCMMITSSGPGEGKSSTAANLALALSQMDQRVLLVDTDLRRPSLMRIFELDPNPGVTDVLTGERSLEGTVKDTGFPNLHILTSGPIPPNPAELFESDQMQALVDKLRHHPDYDMIVFDSAPTLLTTDTPVLAAKMDGVLVVLEAGKTTEEQALMTKEMLLNAGARVIGAVLNKTRMGTGGYYYYGQRKDGGPPSQSTNGRGGLLGSLKGLGEKIGIG